MGRELRWVPANWQHPKKENGEYQPQFELDYNTAILKWVAEHLLWLQGEHPDQKEYPEQTKKYRHFAQWSDDPPLVKYYREIRYRDDELTHIQLYENTTEGTPLTPVFAANDIDKLCEYAEQHATIFGYEKIPAEQWKGILMPYIYNKNQH